MPVKYSRFVRFMRFVRLERIYGTVADSSGIVEFSEVANPNSEVGEVEVFEVRERPDFFRDGARQAAMILSQPRHPLGSEDRSVVNITMTSGQGKGGFSGDDWPERVKLDIKIPVKAAKSGLLCIKCAVDGVEVIVIERYILKEYAG